MAHSDNRNLRTLHRGWRGIAAGTCLALGIISAPPAEAQQCPYGKSPCNAATGFSRVVNVPGNMPMLVAGVPMRPGYVYRATAGGVIKVGIFGEQGTLPDGWDPPQLGGPGFPAPDAYRFSLLYRVGPRGAWQMLGSGPRIIKLGPNDPAGTQIFLGINDPNLADNTGAFLVTIFEEQPGAQCCTNAPAPFPSTITGSSRPRVSSPSPAPVLPCAGKTADGRRQGFKFRLFCSGNYVRDIPIEACTESEARAEAQQYALGQPNCFVN